MSAADLIAHYRKLKAQAATSLTNDAVSQTLIDMALEALDFLVAEANVVPLTSRVAGKTYRAYRIGERISRPINEASFIADPDGLTKAVKSFSAAKLKAMPASDATRLIYTMGMAFYAALDVLKDDDKKTPATHFEILAARIFAMLFAVQPTYAIPLQASAGAVADELPTDYIFDLGTGKPKIHMPVKASTRERVIQVWAHQRILDGAYGHGTYKGVLVALNETKLDRQRLIVTEICVPLQWRVYQKYIAQMDRVYYLDPPAAYLALAPAITVKPFCELFSDLSHFQG
jgi:hypothetical protein